MAFFRCLGYSMYQPFNRVPWFMEIGKASGQFASLKVCDDHRHEIFMRVKGFDLFSGLSDHNFAYYFAAGSPGSLFGERWLFIRALAVVVLRFEDVSLLQHGTI